MEQARFSFNIKFNMAGFDCQFTLRNDEDGEALFSEGMDVLGALAGQGAIPQSRNNGKATPAPNPAPAPKPESSQGAERVCPECGQSDMLELIEWDREGRHHKAWKCQRCVKWLPKEK